MLSTVGLPAPFGQDGPFDTDTRPASIDSGDINSVWFRTDFETAYERDSEGVVTRVLHVPSALLVTLKSTAAFGPPPGGIEGTGMRFRVSASLGTSCGLAFVTTAPVTGTRETTLSISGSGCSTVSLTDPQVTSTSQGNLLTLRLPFSSLAQKDQLQKGTTLSGFSGLTSALVPTSAPLPTSVNVDHAYDNVRQFVVGSDVPADIDCRQTPGHPGCGG